MSLFDERALRELIEDAVRRAIEERLPAVVRAALAEARAPAQRDELEYLTAEDAARVANVKPATVRGWVRAGELPGHRAGRLLRIRRDELAAFLGRGPGPDAGTAEKDAARARELIQLACVPRDSGGSSRRK